MAFPLLSRSVRAATAGSSKICSTQATNIVARAAPSAAFSMQTAVRRAQRTQCLPDSVMRLNRSSSRPSPQLANTLCARRTFASEPNSIDSQRERAKDKAAVGPFNIRAGLVFIATGIGLFFYFRYEKSKVEERKRLESTQAKIGRPKIGGPFELIMPTSISSTRDAKSVEGRKFTEEDLKGAFSLIYFGFTNCPDICPEELDKMAEIVKTVDAKHGPVINPVFITCDPARDTLGATAVYVSEFHPRLIGLTGAYEEIKNACKQFRVYFSTPPGADAASDYLVDHSIFFYLMDPEGKFVDAFGRSVGPQEATAKVMGFVDQWVDAGNTIAKADAKDRVSQDESRRV